ncbi:MAG: alginate export family protein [Elusimicrobia bacterium]|nr:alginate export family protein [Elusimicrobiota bacterium]
MRAPPHLAACALTAVLSTSALGAALDVSTGYRLRALSFKNLKIVDPPQDKSFISQDARLGFAVRNIELTGGGGPEPVTMDVALALHGVGIAGSSGPLTAPFDRIASHYPNAEFLPFIESAYVRAHGLFGYPMDVTFGQQPFAVGSGLFLSDDGVGLAGVSAKGSLPWWDMKLEGYALQPRASQQMAQNLTVYGASLEIPSEGTWQFHQLFERDLRDQTVIGRQASRARRSFSGVRYQISFGPLVFDGEAAMQRGHAVPSGPVPFADRLTYKGDAQQMRAKWKQPLWGGREGIGRLAVARGSGDNPTTASVDEAFFPSRGHRYDGLERAGFGEYFGATPYDAFGGPSTHTATGLPPGASGIIAVGLGLTPPSYKGATLDIDYWLFQADRNFGPHRTLGGEFDFRLRYGFRDRFAMSLSMARFRAGHAISLSKANSRRYALEISGRF